MSAKVLDALKAAHGSAIDSLETQHGDAIAWIKRDHLLAVATWLKSDPAMAFDAPVFATCIDRLDWQPVDVPPGPPVYPATAGFPDDGSKPRFEGAWDLRRIYLYEEFVGYPLRKDYPKEKRQPLVRRDDLPINPLKPGEHR